MGGGAYLTNRNINTNLALKNQQEVDPIQSAINRVTPTTLVPPVVDSLDQAVTPLSSDRTSSELFADFGVAPQAQAVSAAPAQAYDLTKMNQMSQANAQVGDQGQPVALGFSYDPVSGEYVEDASAFGLQGDAAFKRYSPEDFNTKYGQYITPFQAQAAEPVAPVAPVAPAVDLNKQIATNKYGGALKYSELSPEDQAVVDARRAASVDTPPTTYQGVVGQDYGVGQQYGTPEEALSALPAYLSDLEQQREVTDTEFNRLNYDPSEFVRAGFSPTPGSVSKDAALDSTIDYITKNKIPLSKEVDGQTRYLTTGLGADVFRADEDFDYKAGEYKALGPVGTYSTVHVEPVSVLNDPVLSVVGAFLPPVALATTAMKAITGETLHAGDWLKLANAGLSEAGVIEPPSAGAGGMGPVDNGVGLFGTTYDQTQNIMEAAAAAGSDGNPAEILIKGFGVTDDVLDKIGIDSTTFDNSVVDYDAFVEGVEEAASRVAGGDDIEDALKAGALDYIIETAPDIDLGVVTDAVKTVGRVIDDNIFQPIIETVGDIDLGDFEDTVKDLGREFDDEVLQEIKGGIETFAPQVEDFVKTVGGDVVDVVETVGGEVIDALEPIGTAITDIAKVTGSTVGDVLEGVGDIAGDLSDEIGDAIKAGGNALEDFITPIGETIEDIAKATGSTVEDVLKGVASVGEDIIGEVGDVGQDVIDALDPIGTAIEDIAKATGSTVEDVLKGVGELTEDVVTTVGETLEPIATAITDIAKVTGSTVEDVLEGVGDIAGDLSDEIGDAIKAGGDALEDFITPIGETIEDIAKATGSTVEDVLKGVASVGEDIIGEVGDVGQDVIDALEPIGETIEDIAKATGSTVEDVLKGVADVGEDILSGVGDVGQDVIDVIKPIGTAIEDIAKATGSTVEDVLEGVGDIAGDLSDELGDAIKAGGDALEDFITPIGETIEDIAKATGSTVEDVLKGVASVGEDIIGEVGDVGQDVIDALKPVGKTLEDFAKATGSTLEDVLNYIRESELSTEGLLQSGFQQLASQQATEATAARNLALATRTTDSLFSDFKGFKTEIGGTPIELVELIQRNRA
jgi:phage-related protein